MLHVPTGEISAPYSAFPNFRIETDAVKVGSRTEFLSVAYSPIPTNGIGYYELGNYMRGREDIPIWRRMRRDGWLAIVEPIGKIIKRTDPYLEFNRVTDKLRVKQILAFCNWHFDSRGSKIYGLPLERGVIDSKYGGGILCHECAGKRPLKDIADTNVPHFIFYYDQVGKLIFSDNLDQGY